MKRINNNASTYYALAFLLVAFASCAKPRKDTTFTIIETCDLHGKLGLEMGAIAAYTDSVRAQEGSRLLLLDGGDVLQGTPEIYFANRMADTAQHIAARVFNYMDYDAITVGNHDLEAGSLLFDRVYEEMKMAVLAANVLDAKTGEPYFKPYTVFYRNDYKIAVLGLTATQPLDWIDESMSKQFTLQPMEEAARHWISTIRLRENPDMIIGLFHSGFDKEFPHSKDSTITEDATCNHVAYAVPGFDLICGAHTHRLHEGYLVNQAGDTVWIMQGGASGHGLAQAKIVMTNQGIRSITTSAIKTIHHQPSEKYKKMIAPFEAWVHEKVNEPVCQITSPISSNDELTKGGSAWVELIHEALRDAVSRSGVKAGVDMTIACPYIPNATIKAGTLTVSDCITLFPYDDPVYLMEMSGNEVVSYLQYAYDLRFSDSEDRPIYAYDSMSSILYVVTRDTLPHQHVEIIKTSNGTNFFSERRYCVAMSAFRANGGGGYFTKGLNWSPRKLKMRQLWKSKQSFLELMIESFREKGVIDPQPSQNWHIQ